MESSTAATVGSIIERLVRLNAVRDRALNEGRQIIRLSANAIRALHRSECGVARIEIARARSLLDGLRSSLSDHGAVYWAGYVQDAMKEFAEANVVLAIVEGEPIPTPEALGAEDAAFLNGLAEAASELRRLVLDTLRADELEPAERYLQAMDEIYGLLVSVDFPEAITGGLRRTTDQLRPVLERTRGDLTVTLNQRRLERSIERAEAAAAIEKLIPGS